MADGVASPRPDGSGKKPYQKPGLTKLESIRELTQGGATHSGDMGTRKSAGT